MYVCVTLILNFYSKALFLTTIQETIEMFPSFSHLTKQLKLKINVKNKNEKF